MWVCWQFDITSNGLPEGVTAVVNLAGQNVLDPTRRWTPGFKQNVRNSRVNTTHTLAQAITKAKQKPNIFVSISGVGKWDNEHCLLLFFEKYFVIYSL